MQFRAFNIKVIQVNQDESSYDKIKYIFRIKQSLFCLIY